MVDIDFLCGIFGKVLVLVGGYIVCLKIICDYLINKMCIFIFIMVFFFVNLLWIFFILEYLDSFSFWRERLKRIFFFLKDVLVKKGYVCFFISYILLMMIGDSGDMVLKVDFL